MFGEDNLEITYKNQCECFTERRASINKEKEYPAVLVDLLQASNDGKH